MIKNLLTNKTAKEKSQIKSLEIAKLKHSGVFDSAEYTVRVEIIGEVKAIEINGQHSIELFARAWKNGKQLGFGKDGSVEIERFRIFNPPILVDDPNGTIIKESLNPNTGLIVQRTLREDPIDAIRQIIAHNAKIVGIENAPIVMGKVGNTTSTFYPDSATSVDGFSAYLNNTNYATVHDATSGNYTSSGDTFENCCSNSKNVSNQYTIVRGFFLFDTSPLSDSATISSATFSIYGKNKQNTNSDSVSVVSSNPASNTALADADYDQLGTTKYATDITIASFSTSSYNDFSLNASGITAINKTGITKFGTRTAKDISNTAPASQGGDSAEIYYSEQGGAGTTQDPKLVVVDDSVVPLTLSLSASISMSESKFSKIGLINTTVVSISESRTSRAGLNKTVALSIIESISKNIGKSTTDVMSMLESAANTPAFQRNPVESLSFLESKTTLSDFQRTFSDNLIFAETLSKQSGKTLSESFSVVEMISKVSEYQRVLLDSLSVSEAMTKTVIFQRMISETITIIESLQKRTDLSFSSALSIIENVLTRSEYSRNILENVNITESILNALDYKHQLADIIQFLESLAHAVEKRFPSALYKMLTETADRLLLETNDFLLLENAVPLILSLTESKQFATNAYKTELVALAEIISKQTNKPFSDIFTIVDSAFSLYLVRQETKFDSVSISEQFRKDVGANFLTNLNISETKTALVNFIRTFSDSMQITESIAKQLGLTLQELTTFTESLTKLTTHRSTESISIVETSTHATALQKTELVSFSESFRKEAIKQNVENLQLTTSVAYIYPIYVTENVTIQDIIQHDNTKKIVDTFSIFESITKEIKIPKGEILLITEDTAKIIQRSLSGTLDMTEMPSLSTAYHVNLLSAVSLVETLVKNYNISLDEAFSIAATMSTNYTRPFSSQRTTLLTNVGGRILFVAN